MSTSAVIYGAKTKINMSQSIKRAAQVETSLIATLI